MKRPTGTRRSPHVPWCVVLGLSLPLLLTAVWTPVGTRDASTVVHRELTLGTSPRPLQPVPQVAGAQWNWTNLVNATPSLTFPARSAPGLAAYPPASEVVAFGGTAANGTVMGDTWVYGPNWSWTPVTSARSPAARSGPAMAYDATSGVDILFGGRNASGALLRDTWSFAGGHWTALTTQPTPPARTNATLFPDANGTGLILFGGQGTKGLLNDTWWFNLTAGAPHWSNLSLSGPNVPGPRSGAAGTNLSHPAVDVLYGGENGTNASLNDTWTFNGSAWQSVRVKTNPGARWGAALAFDQVDGVDVLFGGFGAKSGVIGSTAVFNGTAWSTPNVGPVHPHPRIGGSMTWASGSAGGIVLLIGGSNDNGTAYGGPYAFASLIPLIVPPPVGSVASIDAGNPVVFNETAVGGQTPYRYAWSGLPTPCSGTSTANVACRPDSNSTDQVFDHPAVRVTDARNVSLQSLSTYLVINAPLVLVGLDLTPNPVQVGTPLTVSVDRTGGAAPLRVSYTGLPPGCVSENLTVFTCTPTSAGSFDVNVTVVDPYGQNASLISSVEVQSNGPSSTTIGLAYIALGVIIVAVVVVLGIRRARQTRPPASTGAADAGPAVPAPGAGPADADPGPPSGVPERPGAPPDP